VSYLETLLNEFQLLEVADPAVKDVTELHQEWSKLRKMLSGWKSRSELKSKLLIKLGRFPFYLPLG
jgi:hypothetical protein